VFKRIIPPHHHAGVQIHDLRLPVRRGHLLPAGTEADDEHRRVRVHRIFPSVSGARVDHPNVVILEHDLVHLGIHDRRILGLLLGRKPLFTCSDLVISHRFSPFVSSVIVFSPSCRYSRP
jgi:hypothetical protein